MLDVRAATSEGMSARKKGGLCDATELSGPTKQRLLDSAQTFSKMGDSNFFKGTSADQDRRFTDKESKLLKTLKFPPEFETKVRRLTATADVLTFQRGIRLICGK